MTSIGNSTFNGCEGLTYVSIPNSVTSIGNYAFYWCNSLISITYCGTMAQWNAISLDEEWYGSSLTTKITEVVCSDGTIQL